MPLLQHTAPAIPSRSAAAAATRWLLVISAGAVAAVQGYGFGLQLGGALLGIVLALNAGVMAALLVDGALDALQHLGSRWRSQRSE